MRHIRDPDLRQLCPLVVVSQRVDMFVARLEPLQREHFRGALSRFQQGCVDALFRAMDQRNFALIQEPEQSVFALLLAVGEQGDFQICDGFWITIRNHRGTLLVAKAWHSAVR